MLQNLRDKLEAAWVFAEMAIVLSALILIIAPFAIVIHGAGAIASALSPLFRDI